MEVCNKQRVSHIHNMIIEMALGNFHYQIERSSKNDDLESIIVGLNMLAEELEASIVHLGFANSHTTTIAIVKMSFILDKYGVVEMANAQAGKMLSLPEEAILGQFFEDFLTEDSKLLWKRKQNGKRPKLEGSLHLVFKHKKRLEIPKLVHFTTFKDRADKTNKTLITVIQHSNYQNRLKSELKKKVINAKYKREKTLNHPAALLKNKILLTFGDLEKIRAAYDMITHHPQRDYPSQKDFALQLGTNEFKLKYGFKALYGTTVHNLIIEERLRKAQIMIQYTDHLFKTIAHQSGFNSHSHFSRIFKKRFGYAPKDLRDQTLIKDNL